LPHDAAPHGPPAARDRSLRVSASAKRSSPEVTALSAFRVGSRLSTGSSATVHEMPVADAALALAHGPDDPTPGPYLRWMVKARRRRAGWPTCQDLDEALVHPDGPDVVPALSMKRPASVRPLAHLSTRIRGVVPDMRQVGVWVCRHLVLGQVAEAARVLRVLFLWHGVRVDLGHGVRFVRCTLPQPSKTALMSTGEAGPIAPARVPERPRCRCSR
jgi:hypothetical protein